VTGIDEGAFMERIKDASGRISPARRFLREAHGATAIEYSVVAAGVAMAVVGVIRVLGANVLTNLYSQLAGLFG
jgi:pilus assembly protein Flp/PilA